MANDKKSPFTKSTVLLVGGILLFLWCVLLILSPCTRLRYLAYPVHFLLGDVGLWIFCLLGAEIAVHMVFSSRIGKYRARNFFGIFFVVIGLWSLLVSILGSGAYPGNDFTAKLNAAYAGNGQDLYFANHLAGGIIGSNLFGSIEASVGAFLNYIIASILFVLGLFLLTLPLLRRLIKGARTQSAIARSKRERRKEEKAKYEENDYVIEDEEAPAPVEYPPLGETPTLNFQQHEEVKEEPLPRFGNDYVFAPAGRSTLPSRKSLRHQRTEVSRYEDEVEGDPLSGIVPTAPQEIDNPPLSSYAHNPIRTSGLKEAVFTFGEEEEYAPRQASIKPSVPPIAESKPEPAPFIPPVMEPEPKPEPRTLIEELTPTLVTSEDVPDVIASSGEEDDDHFVPPSNDPIVLAPNPDVILTPTTILPDPEPTPVKAAPAPALAAEQEPAPVDDDLEGPLPPYVYPDVSLLDKGDASVDIEAARAECASKSEIIDRVFAEFGVGAHVADTLIGPSFTRFSIQADPGVSVTAIGRCMPDLEVRLGGVSIRFVERVAGYAYSAMEIANKVRRIVPFKEVFENLPPYKDTADLHIPFGIDISGQLKEADLSKFPHMLVAGTSGSGKSIFAHGILMSLVMRNRPENLKLVLIDPKRGVEMAPYKDLPHLLCPIVKEAVPAKNCLKKLCDVMDERYKMFEQNGVRDIKSYNADYALPNGKKRMAYIVVFVDEFADLVGECKDISEYVLRIAQKARACGIHLIVATQRPDVKVITGTIKSNLLCRVALTVASSTDSQTILGVGGAEELCGYGDMLIDCQELSKRDFVRAQGCLGTSGEMKRVNDFIRKQLPPNYDPDFLNLDDPEEESGPEIRDGGYAPIAPEVSLADMRKASDEEKYQYIKSAIMAREYCSISLIQREFEVGFPRAGKIMNRLQKEGIVAPAGDSANNSKGCRVLVHEDTGATTGDLPEN